MDDRTIYCIAIAVTLALAAVLRKAWITPKRFPVVSARRWSREFLSSAAAFLFVASIFFMLGLLHQDVPSPFTPSLVFAQVGATALYFCHISLAIPPSGEFRDAAIAKVWSQMMGTVCLGYAAVLIPRSFRFELLASAIELLVPFAVIVSVALCWYSYWFRKHLPRPMWVAGVMQLLIPMFLVYLMRQSG